MKKMHGSSVEWTCEGYAYYHSRIKTWIWNKF